jgi:hypothetical protein
MAVSLGILGRGRRCSAGSNVLTVEVHSRGYWRLCAAGIDAETAGQGLGWWWARLLGLLLITTLFSLPHTLPLARAGLLGLGYLCGSSVAAVWRLHEVWGNAWTTTFAVWRLHEVCGGILFYLSSYRLGFYR